jgi:organic hydroperoxide reductase OsmC/OhrA
MAHTYTATARWQRGDQVFTDNKYSRAHDLVFDGGAIVRGSSAPSSVPLPYSDAAAVDPEEALVGALSACHMLFFLAFAGKRGFRVDSYEGVALGEMTKNAAGKLHISKVTLSPRIVFSGDKRPTAEDVAAMHHRSHEECYIANSIRAEVVVAEIAPIYA